MSKKAQSILFICPYPAGQAPSQRFRFEQYFNILGHANFRFEIASFLTPGAWTILYSKGRTFRKVIATLSGFVRRAWVIVVRAPRFDYIFIHREAAPIGPPVAEWILARIFRKRIIYDFDDAIWLPNTSEENKIAALVKMPGKVRSICRWSYKVSCGNGYLCDFARAYNSQVVLNPTTIDTENLHNPASYEHRPDGHQITIGWTGTHSTLKYLTPLVPVLAELESQFPGQIQFLVISDRKPDLAVKGLLFIKWNKSTEIQDLLKMDIGTMPLTDDLWAKGKCGFKALQYMALGIPALASPIGVNTAIIEHGENGYLCDTPAQWKDCLVQLILNKQLRHEVGEKGREKVIGHYSVLSNASTFLSLFE